MPRAQFEALVARQQARRDRGTDSDKLNVQDGDEDEDGNNASQVEVAPLDARICTTTTDMFKRVLLFSRGGTDKITKNNLLILLFFQ